MLIRVATSRLPVNIWRIPAMVFRNIRGLRGRARLGAWCYEHVPTVQRDWRIRMTDGTVMVLPTHCRQTWTTAFSGTYAEEALALLTPHISNNTVVIDIGASLGLVTVPLAKLAAERAASVVAYEPVSSNLVYLKRNLDQNYLNNVVLVRGVALGEEPGTVVMKVEGQAGNAVVLAGADARRADTVRAKVTTLDEEWPDLPGRCSAIKLDVEGFELAVLRGGAHLIDKDRPVIYAEFNRDWLAYRSVTVSSLDAWLQEVNYCIIAIMRVRQKPWRPQVIGALRPVGQLSEAAGDVLLAPVERLDQIAIDNDH